MFAGEWTIKVLGWLGMEEGMAIEDKRISKGILRAQKKVEERNYLARKNLLEYDEVMDHQRTTFYGMRQQVLEGRDVDQVIWTFIREAIRDAVDKYITQDYVAANVAEWARINFEVNLDAADFKGYRSYEDIEPFYQEAEERIGVSGSPGPKELEIRSKPYPLPPLPLSYNLTLLKEWAEKSGIPRKTAVEVLTNSVIASPMVQYRGPMVLQMPDEAWFDMKMMQKDTSLALEMGRRLAVPLPTTSVANEFLTAARGMGLTEKDFAAIFQVLAKMSGVPV